MEKGDAAMEHSENPTSSLHREQGCRCLQVQRGNQFPASSRILGNDAQVGQLQATALWPRITYPG